MNIESLLPVLGELLVKSGAILLVAALALRMWRGATAAQRHLVCFAAIVTMLLLPVTRWVTPWWAVPLRHETKIHGPGTALPLASLGDAHIASTSAGAAPRARGWTLPDWREVLVGVWLSGTVLLIGYRLLGSWRLHQLRRRSASPDDPRLRLLFSRTLSELGLSRRPDIRLSDECRVPITWGTLRPVMLLPRQALQWNDGWLAAALRHEAAHIRRHDYLTRAIAQLACALYWPNPFLWLLARSLRVAQEQAADDLVLCAGSPAEQYAEQLVAAARTVATQGFLVSPAVAMACPSTLEDRVRAIVDDRRARRPLSRLAVVVGSGAALLTLALCTVAQLQGADPAPPVPPPAVDAPAGSKAAPAAPNDAAPGAVLALLPIRSEEAADSAAGQHFTLHIPIQPRAGAELKASDFVIHVLFYDRAEDGKLLPTNAEVRSHWAEPPDDWSTGRAQQLEVEYQAAPLEKGAPRKYFGYLVRLYYQGQFQGAAAEPERLLKEFPSPARLPAARSAPPAKAPGAAPRGGGKAEDAFIEVIHAMDEGERLEKAGDLRGSLAALRRAAQALEAVKTLGPDWEPKLVAYRQELAKEAIQRLTPKAEVPAGKAPAGKAAGESAALKKAEGIILPKVDFREATVTEMFDFLRTQALELDPEKTGVNIVVQPGKGSDARVTVSLSNIPLSEAVKYAASLAGLKLRAEGDD